jgi:crotonobetainyl-CoA:carnitine CoA-transferase CaiB-like acyl-CoA transferase
MAAGGARDFTPLRGITVVEHAGALAAAACAHLLARLGARVIRLEGPGEKQRLADANAAERRLRTAHKERRDIDGGDGMAAWQPALAAADVVLFAPPAPGVPEHALLAPLMTERPSGPVACAFSLCGRDAPDDMACVTDAAAQALGGLMAVTGRRDGPPEHAHVPIAQLTAAAVGVTAVLAALARRRSGGGCAFVDLSLIEIMADQLRTHIGLVERGQTRGFRIGCEHPLCAPWNAYRARDGWLLLCTSGDAHWHALTALMECPELARDPRFESMPQRRRHAAQIDALVQRWVGRHEREAALDALIAADVPAGPALERHAVADDATLRAAGTVAIETESGRAVPAMPWRFRPTAPHAPRAANDAKGRPGSLPLAGVRVIELTRYAAGPLAGFVLASLGADVIKIEPPAGEECRAWTPQYEGVSSYFANHNAGKRSVSADLRTEAGKRIVTRLLAAADVLLHIMRPGAMERLGLGGDALCQAHPQLVYCTISGFGPAGPQLPALDTVVQARLGLTALAGDGTAPLRIGYSIADQLAGHFAAGGILAALHARNEHGAGGVLDVAMTDALAWLTHLAWQGDAPALPPTQRVPAADGWVVASGTSAQVDAACPASHRLAREEIVARLQEHGIAAAPVLEVDEVLRHPTLERRRSLCAVESGTHARVPVFAAPLGMPVARPERMRTLGEDLPEWNPS